jgi:RNA polymerase sigma-70 factor (ECF subfamily)
MRLFSECPDHSQVLKRSFDHSMELIARIQHGDSLAFRDFVEENQSKVFLLLYRVLENRTEADEIAQKAFVRMHRNMQRVNFSREFTTWMYKATVHELFVELRITRARALLERVLHPLSSARKSTAVDQNIGKPPNAGSDIQVQLRKLTYGERTLILLREFAQCSVEQVAQIMGLGVKDTKARLLKVRQKLILGPSALKPEG